MKRGSYRDERDRSDSKRHRVSDLDFNEAIKSGQFELRLLIPTKAAGAVIGKGGENVNGMSRKYDASISVPDKRTAERVVTIVAKKSVILDVFKDILRIIIDQDNNRRGRPEARVIVHQSHVGVIMGRQGANVKELGAKTKTQITIFKDVCPDSTDRVVLIVGQEENIVEVVKSLIKDMADFPIKALQRPYDAANYDPRNAVHYGGIVTSGYDDDRGRRERYMSPPRHTPGARDDYGSRDRSRYSSERDRRTVEPFLDRRGVSPPRFDREAVALAVQQQQLQLQQQQLQQQQQQPAMAFSEEYLRGSEVASIQMAIPKELSGKITGSSGEIVARIQQDSGARIDMGVTITGTPQQIEMAQLLIKQSIRKPDVPQSRAYYVDEHLMNERIPDESGLVSRKPEIARYYLDEALDQVNLLAKYKM